MNLLHIVNVSSPYPGNLMASLYRLENKMDKKGEFVYLFPKASENLYWIKEMQEENKKVYFKSGNVNKDIFQIRQICEEYKINIIHLHFWNIPDCLAMKIAKIGNRKITTIIHHHSMYVESKSPVREKIKQIILSGNFHIICGAGMYQVYKKNHWFEKKSYCVENKIDFQRLDSYEKIKWNGIQAFTFSSCGCEIKGIDISCKAIRMVRNSGRDITLNIVASENANGVGDFVKHTLNVEILPEWIKILPPREDIATYYNAADIFISASRSEGLCFAVAEAIYSNCECIQSNIPQNRLDIPECKVFESENVEQLKEKILEALDESEDEKTRINQLQHNYVVNKYGIDSWVREIMDVYEKVLNIERKK